MPARIDVMVVCKLPACGQTFKSRKTRSGYQEYCSRDCWFRRTEYIIFTGEKMCTSCKVLLPLKSFNKQKHGAAKVMSKCRVCSSEYNFNYENKFKTRKTSTAKKYSLTLDEYVSLISGSCAVCGLKSNFKNYSTKVNLNIDHDHSCCPGDNSCGKCIRGVLCMDHNTALGKVHDNIDELKNMIAYLENYNDR